MRSKVESDFRSYISVLNNERQQEQGSRAKHSRVTCTFGPRGRGGGGGGGVGRAVTSYIWHIMDVRAKWPPFSALSSI